MYDVMVYMNDNEIEKTQKTIRISEQAYNRLSELGTVKQTFNEVIERLINFHEAHNTGMHSSSMQILKESVDFPVNEEYKQIATQLFEEILSIGNNVSFTLRIDPGELPLIENRNNIVTFYRSNKALCLIKTGRDMVLFYIPTEQIGTDLSGWKDDGNIHTEFALERDMKIIKRLYEDM